MNFNFFLVGQGLPDVCPSASLPIAPASMHPDARHAVETNAELPWDSLYVHTLYNFTTLVSRLHTGLNPLAVRVTKESLASLRSLQMDDEGQYPNDVPEIGHVLL